MSLFHRKKEPAFDRDKLQPAVRKSYCNREMAVGFIEKDTGKFREFGCANSQSELEAFCSKLGISVDDLKVFY